MKVIIGIPIRHIKGEPKPRTQECINLLRAQTKHAVEVYYARGQQITQNSFYIVHKALNEGWDYLLYTGDDITFPPDALDKMIARDKDIVCGVCTWKTPPFWVPAANVVDGVLKQALISPEMIEKQVCERYDQIGSGFMLIKRKVLQGIDDFLRDKVYREITPEYRWMCPVPYFPVTYDADKNVIIGSDYSFCRLAKQAGFESWLDCGVVCGHNWEGEYDIRDHWRWIEEHGFGRELPRWPGEQIAYTPIDPKAVYLPNALKPIPITVTSAGNEYHAIEHVFPILMSHYAHLKDAKEHGKTDAGYIIGFHVNQDSTFDDYMAFANKFKRVLIHWVGSDIMNLPSWLSEEHRAVLNESRFVHLVEDERLKPELDGYFQNLRVLAIPTAKTIPILPLPENFTVACYYPKHRHDFHYGDVLRQVIERMPDVKFKLFHLFGEKPDFNYPNMAWLGHLSDEEYIRQIGRSSCVLRLSKHDGRPFTVVEFALAGRRFITNFDMNHTYRVPDVPCVDDVIEVLQEIRKEAEPYHDAAAYYAKTNSHVAYRDAIVALIAGTERQPYDYVTYWQGRYADGAFGAGGPQRGSEEADFVTNVILHHARNAECKSLLDVGCGSMARWYGLPKGIEYTGIDVSAQAVQFAQEKFPAGTFFVADVTKDAIPDADCVTAIDVFPHIKPEDFDAVVKKVFRAARKVAIVKTSLGVNDNYYQYAHNWTKAMTDSWVCVQQTDVPNNKVAKIMIFEKAEVSVGRA